MAWFFDIILLLILAATAFVGYKRGIMKMLFSLAAVILALVLAFSLAAPTANWAYKVFLEQQVSRGVDNALKNQTDETLGAAVEEFLNKSTIGFIVGGTLDFDVKQTVDDLTGSSVEAAAETLKQDVIRPPAVLLLRAICTVILFVVFWLVLSGVAKILLRVIKLPLIKKADGTLGALVGLVMGISLCIAFCFVLDLSLRVTSVGLLGVTEEIRKQTLLYQFFGNLFGAR